MRLGVGAHLALGFAAVGTVVLAAHVLAKRTTDTAMEAVRNVQREYQPLALHAASLVAELAAFDRTVAEYLKSGQSADYALLTRTASALNAATEAYFSTAAHEQSEAARSLPLHLAEHLEHGRELANRSGRRAQWLERRRSLLEAETHRISAAGGGGLVIGDGQVLSRRSLADLSVALSAVRASHDQLSAAGASERAASDCSCAAVEK